MIVQSELGSILEPGRQFSSTDLIVFVMMVSFEVRS